MREDVSLDYRAKALAVIAHAISRHQPVPPAAPDMAPSSIAAPVPTPHNRITGERGCAREDTMSGDFDPREYDTRERHDGIHDRRDEWPVIGPDHDLAVPRDESNDHHDLIEGIGVPACE